MDPPLSILFLFYLYCPFININVQCRYYLIIILGPPLSILIIFYLHCPFINITTMYL
jgi:hypothetical protein